VAVVLVVGETHRHSFSSLDEIAKEKLSALEGLTKGGTAIINADDQRLTTVESNNVFKVSKFGTSSSCDLYAENITSRWPERLTFDVRSATETVQIRTQLVGTHWIPSLLASLLTAQHCGVPLNEAAEIAPKFKPFPARMQPVQLPSGAIVIRDEYNGSPSSFRTALEAFESAEAKRKILIAGDYSDSTVKRRRRLTRLGRAAASLCDLAIFIGEHSYHSREAAIQAGLGSRKALSFSYPQDAVSVLKRELGEGDLVMLKSRSNDHLSRLLFAQVGEVVCWRPTCPERFLCDICWRLGCDSCDMAKIKPV
jgi:UDP-N-acetylmuramoyl-tripeptide--D-alanyl-D-alanine ligase